MAAKKKKKTSRAVETTVNKATPATELVEHDGVSSALENPKNTTDQDVVHVEPEELQIQEVSQEKVKQTNGASARGDLLQHLSNSAFRERVIHYVVKNLR